MQELISVIVPVYNSELYLKKCIESIINQTYDNIEIILVDDGSIDNSAKICKEYESKDSRVKVYLKENGGAASARNLGIQMSSGSYIGFVDSDDYIDAYMYEKLMDVMLKNDCQVTKAILEPKLNYGSVEHLYEDDRLFILSIGEVSVCNSLFKKNLIENVRFQEGVSYEDTIFTIDVLKCIKKISILNEGLYKYCTHKDTTTSTALKKRDLEKIKIYDECKNYFLKSCDNTKKVNKFIELGKKISIFDIVVKIANYGYDDTLSVSEVEKVISDIHTIYKGGVIEILTNKNISARKKIQIAIFNLNPKMYFKIKNKYYLLRRGMKINVKK